MRTLEEYIRDNIRDQSSEFDDVDQRIEELTMGKIVKYISDYLERRNDNENAYISTLSIQ